MPSRCSSAGDVNAARAAGLGIDIGNRFRGKQGSLERLDGRNIGLWRSRLDHNANADLGERGAGAGNDLALLDQAFDRFGRQNRDIELLLAATDQIEVLSDGLIGDVELVAGFLLILRGKRVEHLLESAAADDFDRGGLGKLRHDEGQCGCENCGLELHAEFLTRAMSIGAIVTF